MAFVQLCMPVNIFKYKTWSRLNKSKHLNQTNRQKVE